MTQTAVQFFDKELQKVMFIEYGELRGIIIPLEEYVRIKKLAINLEKEQHSKTWDTALDKYEVRAGNYMRAYEDFDDYFQEEYIKNKMMTKQIKNVHVLPTDKPSRIYLIKSNNKLGITSNNPEFTENFGSGTQNQNIYITSDEEIKEGDWFLDLMNNTIYVATKVVVHNLKSLEYEQYLKKIILTTDQDLIKDGVQPIDDDFLEWFIKHPSCEEVEVEKTAPIRPFGSLYKIIIPKEKPKQETLEEAMERYLDSPLPHSYKRAVEFSAKWQQERSYSEIIEFTKWFSDFNGLTFNEKKVTKEHLIKLYNEQFKNK